MSYDHDFETHLIESGPGYAVGYAFGELTVYWYVVPNLIKAGWSIEEISTGLKFDPKDITPATELFGPNDEQATAVLRERIKQLMVRGYGDIFPLDVIESMVDKECPRIKELIRNPKWNRT